MTWSVYIILSTENTYYTGITTDMDRRWAEHCSGKKGAKYFNSCKPLKIVYFETGHSRSTASKREAQIKAMRRAEKTQLVKSFAEVPK